MKKEGKSRSEAYKIALTKFYERRAAEELEQHIAAQEALSYGAVPFHKPQVDETLRYEKKMLKESEGIITRRAELRQSGAAATEKSFTVVTPTA
ncbi:hypothetical protein EV182_006379 [Spiromyces aspiralis]|uniref:Uncharacterized protein n=1 Tax=Spiromyces aspiralis TaxID=68401 RepID=A0ACC1HLH1_9FUNG|nr:hypothetical protein EV182_006379 [Spiromyces aspiralis]